MIPLGVLVPATIIGGALYALEEIGTFFLWPPLFGLGPVLWRDTLQIPRLAGVFPHQESGRTRHARFATQDDQVTRFRARGISSFKGELTFQGAQVMVEVRGSIAGFLLSPIVLIWLNEHWLPPQSRFSPAMIVAMLVAGIAGQYFYEHHEAAGAAYEVTKAITDAHERAV